MFEAAPGIVARIVRPMPALDAPTEAEIDRCWAHGIATRPLFNGLVFSADRISPSLIEGHWTEYRRVLACLLEPGLQARIGLRSLAVCGVLHGPDGIALARRDPSAVYQAGQWQLPPAGSVDGLCADGNGVDLRRALLNELWEELGLTAEAVTSIRPLCLVQHPESGVLDLGYEIATTLRRDAILAAHAAHGNGEYADLVIVPLGDVASTVAARGGTLVPSAHAFLDRVSRPG